MIQEFFNSMITLMLAKFMLNDVPHAAGMFSGGPIVSQYTYHLGTLPKSVEDDIARMTFTTKAETARHYRFHIYVPEQSAWLAPRNVSDPNWETILPKLEHGNTAPVPTGTCYEDAWRFLFLHEEGFLIHGSVKLTEEGKSVKHAWIELPYGWIWEPQTRQYFTTDEFGRMFDPVIDATYTLEQAAIMLARAGKHGPWSAEERREYIGR